MNAELKTKSKNDFEKYFFKLMNNSVLGKTMGNVRKHRDIKRETTYRGRTHLVSESIITQQNRSQKSYWHRYEQKRHKNEQAGVFRSVDFGLEQDWYDYAKPKYGNKAKICYKDT